MTEPAKTKSKETNKWDKPTAKVSSNRYKSTVKKHTNMDNKELKKKDIMMVRRSSFQKSLPCLRRPSLYMCYIFIWYQK